MTGALDAMVKAIANEIERQTLYFHIDDEKVRWIRGAAEDGSFDFEKVARAGLAAIRELPDSLYDDGAALDPDVIGYDRAPETYWQAIVDKFLE